jgi:hypothetical protein
MPKCQSLAQLMHLRIGFLVTAFGRWRRGDQGRVDNGACSHRQTFVRRVPVHVMEGPTRQVACPKQAPELEQRRRVWRRFVCQVDAQKIAHRLDVIDRILDSFIRQAEALLGDVHVQHAPQANRRTPPTGSGRAKAIRAKN